MREFSVISKKNLDNRLQGLDNGTTHKSTAMYLYYRIACRTSVMETTAVPFNGTGKLGKMSERGNKFTEAAEGHFSGTLTNASLQALLCESCGA